MTMIMVDIDALSITEKKELLARLSYDLRGSKSEGPDAGDELWDAINDTLKYPGRRKMPFDRFLENYGKARYKLRSEQLTELMDHAMPKGVRKPVVMSVRRLMLGCLRDYLCSRDIPVSASSLLNSFEMLKYAVDAAYPGYIEAKLLHRVAGSFFG